jgi:hypothetical protein
VLPYASYYMTGFLHERPLARVRADLARLGIERSDEQREPEDHIAILCDVMAGLASGRLGRDFAAERDFFDRYNHELVDINRISLEGMENHLQHLRSLMQLHIGATGSTWARQLFGDFREVLHKVWLVKPKAASLAALSSELRQAA